jgi:hypothetical protein
VAGVVGQAPQGAHDGVDRRDEAVNAGGEAVAGGEGARPQGFRGAGGEEVDEGAAGGGGGELAGESAVADGGA